LSLERKRNAQRAGRPDDPADSSLLSSGSHRFYAFVASATAALREVKGNVLEVDEQSVVFYTKAASRQLFDARCQQLSSTI